MKLLPIVLITESRQHQAALERRFVVHVARSGRQAAQMASQHRARAIILDAISLKTPGDRICRMLRKQAPGVPLVHLCPANVQQPLADVVLHLPFTTRKVINAVDRLIRSAKSHQLSCGPFRLDLENRLLYARGDEISLTPKQADLLRIFFENPDRTLERKWIMQEVWHTDYTGDTRTLDVHIRWVRRVLEPEAGKTQYLQTVRGVGYRFQMDCAANPQETSQET